MEPFRNQSEQVLELVGHVVPGMVPGAVSFQLAAFGIFPQALGLALLHDAADFAAAGIVFDADAHVAEPFPVQEGELLAGQFPGPVADVLEFTEADEVVFRILHRHLVISFCG